MRVKLSPLAAQAPGLFDLPWAQPLEEWADSAVVPPSLPDPHRHVIRFVEDAGVIWVIKELPPPLAWREHRLLGRLADLGIPSVSVHGVVIDRAPGVDAALVTRYLKYSFTYQDLYRDPLCHFQHELLVDALVELLVRLHLAGCYWGDASLSNSLFRRDAGALAAYLVDAETAELHPSLSGGQRRTDVSQACEQVAGELLDLQTGGLLTADIDAVAVAFDIEPRYQRLWEELSGEWITHPGEERRRVREQLNRLDHLGFVPKEIEIADSGPDRTRLRMTAQASQPGRDRQRLYQRTGLVAQPHQARHLLNELSSFRVGLQVTTGRPVSEIVAANQWLTEIYDPVAARIPADLRDKLDPVEVLNDVLGQRRVLSKEAGHDVSIQTATAAYFAHLQPQVPGVLTGRQLNPSHQNRAAVTRAASRPARAGNPSSPGPGSGAVDLGVSATLQLAGKAVSRQTYPQEWCWRRRRQSHLVRS
jgi:Domain of unknown function (DUF4032)